MPSRATVMCQTTTVDVDALLAEVRSRQPRACPSCASEQIQPTFLADDEFDCSECCAIWRQGQ